jgi:glucose-6-phosphate 1-dehydrogenase
MVIFGASGDLTGRELLPSLYELWRKDLLPDPFAVLGTARTDWDDDSFREEMRRWVDPEDPERWREFARRVHYVCTDLTAPPDADYARLEERIGEVRELHGIPDHVLYHLAVPPAFFTETARKMKAAGLATSDSGWRRLVVEKPFGTDRESAEELNRALQTAFPEDQIYRIDHYLGKETVQNMLVFRFANPGWEPIWNRNYIDHVQITASEQLGIGDRAGFYEKTGVVRDMVQNHLLQLFCITAIEPPVRCLGTSVRDETAKVLGAVNHLNPARDFVAGQYGPGRIDGTRVAGYREEDGVDPDSTTPTFAALRLTVDNWRWAGVPFYLRTGKRLERKLTEVVVHFRPTPHTMFPGQGDAHRNVLAFRLQPREGIVQRFAAKRPGPELSIEPVQMNFGYAGAFGIEEPPRAYAWLLLDAMQGDQTLFARSDWIRRAWSVVDPLVDHWEEGDGVPELPNYEAGSWGPDAARQLIQADGREWTEI